MNKNVYRWIVVIGMVAPARGCAADPGPATTNAIQSSPIRYERVERDDPQRVVMHIMRIDLGDPRVRIGAFAASDDPDGEGPWQVKLQTVRAIARRERLDAAVNGNFFAPRSAANVAGRKIPYFVGNWARAVGWLVCDGTLIADTSAAQAALVVSRDGRVRIGRFDVIPDDARDVVSGSQLLLSRGKNVATDTPRAPRTGAGITADRKTLVLLVVDGRLVSHSAGMTERELGEALLRLGCVDAVNLDGGGSSTMVMRDGEAWRVVNRPSDGHDLPIPMSIERPVASVLGVRVDQK